MPKYPVKSNQIGLPMSCPSIPQSIVPNGSKGRSVGGQVKTVIHMRNARGEEVTIYQNQQMLNLTDSARGFWSIGDASSRSIPDNSHGNSNQRRSRNVYPRKNH